MSGQQSFDQDPMTGEIMPREIQQSAPPPGGAVSIATFGSVITAQKVAVERNDVKIMAKLRVLCGIAGQRYVYSWPVKDRKNRRETIIEGPTVKLANDLFRTYGNCGYDVRVIDDGTHIIFYGRFTDYESGASYERPFRQRKEQNTGMKDAARAADMIFQIGASKCFRNCIVNMLSTHVDYMLEESKKKLVEYVKDNPDKVMGYIEKIRDRFNIELPRIEAVVGRKQDDWLTRDLARVMMEMRGLEDGMASANDLYPTDADAEEVMAEKGAAKLDKLADDNAETPEPKPAAKKAAKKAPAKKAAKKAAAKKPEPEPEHEDVRSEGEAETESPEPEPETEEAPEADDTEEEEPEEGDDGPPLFGEDS